MITTGIILFILNSGLGIFTLLKRKNKEGIVFGLLSITLSIWVLSVYLTIFTSSLMWGRLAFAGVILSIGLLLLFAIIFPGNRKVTLGKIFCVLFLPVTLSLATATNLMVKSVSVNGFSITGTFGGLMSLYQLYAPIYVLLSIGLIIRTYIKTTSILHRNQVKYFLIGMILFAFPATLTNVILPLWFNSYSLNALGPAFSVCLVGFISFAIVRHQFLDIKVIIQRGLIYTILLSILVGVYVTLIFTMEYIVNFSEQDIFLSAFITTIIGIFGVPPLTEFFKRATDPFFFKNTYDYAHTIKELTRTLNTTLSKEKIIEQSTHTLTETIKPTYVTFALSKSEETAGVINLPIISNGKKIGLLILGEKKSGDQYTTQDISLLETFTSLAGTALEKASLYSQVEEYAKNLEIKVDERTKEVLTIQKEKDALLAEISHGLQTPLTIIKGEIFLLKKTDTPQESLEIFDASVDRISSFINRLLSLSKIENSSKETWATFDLGQLLETITLLFKQTSEREGVTLTTNHQKHIPFFGNKEEIDELISNILSNALKYIGNKKDKMVSLTSTITNNIVTITITDNGVGLKNDDISKLFKKFSRIKNEATKGIIGTGLGLAICEKIAQKHGGSISVQSTFGEGSTFTITLPIKPA